MDSQTQDSFNGSSEIDEAICVSTICVIID